MSDRRDYCTHPQWELVSYTHSTIERAASPIATTLRCSHCRIEQVYERHTPRTALGEPMEAKK